MAESNARWYYMLLRWVPNPARGEFINIGCIVFDNAEQDNMALRLSGRKRANRLDQIPEALEEMIESTMARLWDAAPEERVETGRQMVHDHRNIVQFSTPLPMVAQSTSQALDFIFPKLVGDE